MSVAAAAASAMLTSKSVRPCPITTSIKYLVDAGNTRPIAWLMIMRTAPSASRRRCVHTSSRASAHADDHRIFLFGSAIRYNSTLPLALAVAHCSDPSCVRKVLLKVSNRHVLASALLIVVLLTCVYAFQTPVLEQIKGATVQFRIYEQNDEGATNELGSKTAYLSSFGNWTTIKRNVQGVT